jgi:hypothetical protein
VARGVKRDRMDDVEKESKGVKNAKLRKALEEVERTLGGVVGMESGGMMITT